MSGHRIEWEDDRMAGVTCLTDPKKYASTIFCAGEPQGCSVCGQALVLNWSVTLTPVAPTPTEEAPVTDEPRTREWSAWSFCRTLLSQGTDIQMDRNAGKYPTYEHMSARLDEAARERGEVLEAHLGAARAAGYAEAMARECLWTRCNEEDGSWGWDGECGGYKPCGYTLLPTPYCASCGGKVRVEEGGA